MLRSVFVCLLACSLLLIAAGCKSQPLMSEDPLTESEREPQWVSKGISAFPDEIGKVFAGVGIAEAKRVPNLSLRRSEAIQDAHLDIARQLRSFVQAVHDRYAEDVFTPSSDVAESRSIVEAVQRSVVDETLVGAQPMDTWRNPRNGDYYALVKLSMDTVAQQLRQKMIAVEKDRLRVDAAKAHEKLDEIIKKTRQQEKW